MAYFFLKKIFEVGVIFSLIFVCIGNAFAASLSQADEARLKGKFSAAISEYRGVLASRTDEGSWPAASLGMADCYAQLGRHKRAAELYSEVVKKYPQDARAPEAAWHVIRLSCGPLRDRKEGLRMAEVLANWQPTSEYNQRGLYSKALILYWDGRPKQAADSLRRYIFLYGNGLYAEAARKLLQELGG